MFNYSGDFPFLWDEITLPIKYGSDYRLARTLFEQTLLETTGDYSAKAKTSWLGLIEQYRIDPTELDPRVYLAADDNWITLRYAVDYKRHRITKDLLFTRVLDDIQRSQSRVALASATVHLVEAPELKVALVRSQGTTQS
ncbi:hypothetical protein YTPLAS18_04520 [Nitrospira sp.]|nr:hypothetical protein YTPLAS18_04520 [Nitrospira sp.]